MARTTIVRVLASMMMVTGIASTALAASNDQRPADSRSWFGSSFRYYNIPGVQQRDSEKIPYKGPTSDGGSGSIPPLSVALSVDNGKVIQPTSDSGDTNTSTVINGMTVNAHEKNMVFDITGSVPSTAADAKTTTAKVIATGGPNGNTFTVSQLQTAAANLGSSDKQLASCSATSCLNGNPTSDGGKFPKITWPAYAQIKTNNGSVNDTITFDVRDNELSANPNEKTIRVAHVTVNRKSALPLLADITSVAVDMKFTHPDDKSQFKVQLLDASGNILGDTSWEYCGNAKETVVASSYPIALSPQTGTIDDIATARVWLSDPDNSQYTPFGNAMGTTVKTVLIQGKTSGNLIFNADQKNPQECPTENGYLTCYNSSSPGADGKVFNLDYPVKLSKWFSTTPAN